MRLLLLILLLGIAITSTQTIRPFTINIEDEVLTDLKARLNRTIWPDQFETAGWEWGMNHPYLKELVTYWQTEFDWRKQEALLNSFPNYKVEIEGVDFHFVQAKAKPGATRVIPLLFLHGWPGSFFEAYKLIPYLITPQDGLAFDVIVPSLVGYGFSGHPKEAGWDHHKMAKGFNSLMRILNYDEYIVQGGDWGGVIAPHVAFYDPQHCIGLHMNFFPGWYSETAKGFIPSIRYFYRMIYNYITGQGDDYSYLARETGYLHIQATKPDTVGMGLSDSPAGLAAYIVEKFYTWADIHGNIESRFTKDELLTNVMIYWVSNSITSSMRLYAQVFSQIFSAETREFSRNFFVSQPSAFANFKDIFRFPKVQVENFVNLVQWNDFDSGGHFAALEEPAVLSRDIRSYAVKLDTIKLKSVEKEL